MIAGRTAGDMPGWTSLNRRSWQNFLDSALRMYATLNRALVEAHRPDPQRCAPAGHPGQIPDGFGAHG